MKRVSLEQRFREEGQTDDFFLELVSSTKTQLYHVIRKMVNDHHITDDLLQNTYLKVFEKLKTYKGESKLKTWVYRIAVNTTLDYIRKTKKKTPTIEVPIDMAAEETPDYESAVEDIILGLAYLPPKQKQIFVMRFFEEQSIEEIAKELEITPGGARSSYHHAQRKIKEWLIEKGWLS